MKVALLLWPDTFEDWYTPLGIDRQRYLDGYDSEWSLAVARVLVAAGVDVHLVFATLERPSVDVHRPTGAMVHFVRSSPVYRAFRQMVWGHRWWPRTSVVWPAAPVASTLSPALVRQLVSLRADACVIQDYESLRFDVLAPILRAAGQRVVALDAGGSARPRHGRWHRWALGSADGLLAAHQAEATRIGGNVWPAPIRTDVFSPGDRAAARRQLGLDRDRPVVLSVGRLHPVKGLHDLADACATLDCELVLAGSGDEHAALAARRQSNLRLVGWVSPEDAARWYAAADVVALASHQEGQPLAVLEAFACGRGVVATAVGGVPDVVTDGDTGWLVPTRDVLSLQVALKDALADVAEADRRGARGREIVLARHEPAIAGAELVSLLHAR